MQQFQHFYIDGDWVLPADGNTAERHSIINPATGNVAYQTPVATKADIERAIQAAKKAFPKWGATSAKERADYLRAIADGIDRREDDLAEAITATMGCPSKLVKGLQVRGISDAFRSFAERTSLMEEIDEREGFSVLKQPVGVCALINPWNYPLSQLAGKLAPALAAGCAVITKPAEQTPVQDIIVAEVCHDVGLPSGVVNVLLGHGPDIGPVLCSHPDVDMVSFTGSTRAGRQITQYAADTIKRVTLELGGKSPYIVTENADIESAVKDCITKVMINSGQSCNAPTRLLIPKARYDDAVATAKKAAEKFVVGDPSVRETFIGPLSSEQQQQRVISYIEKGIAEGACLITGGTEYPEGIIEGAFVKPTVFADVNNSMVIAQEEIFGPVACLIAYEDIQQAIHIANDTVYGLSSNVYGENEAEAFAIAQQICAGQTFIQGGSFHGEAPFGGYKQSGNGREWGDEGLMEYCEIKSIIS